MNNNKTRVEDRPWDEESPVPAPRARGLGWFGAWLSVALVGGAVVGLLEPVVQMRSHLAMATGRLWLNAFSISLISHSVVALTATAVACIVGALASRLVPRLASVFRPGATALASLIVAEAILFVSVYAFYAHDFRLPDGWIGVGGLVLVWLAALVPVTVICARVGSGRIGRALARVRPACTGVAVVLLLGSVGFQLQAKPRMFSAEGFWPPEESPRPTNPADRPPDIVFIVFDTLRADRLGCYGYDRPTSPHIDAFAADATLFRWAISPGVWTLPAHASMFTGLFPSQHGADFGRDRLWLDGGFTTLAECLKERGYQTMALSNNPLVSPWTNLTQGFDRFVDPGQLTYAKRNGPRDFVQYVCMNDAPLGPLLGRWFAHDAGGRATTELAESWLGSRDRSRPLLLFVNYMETHRRYDPPEAYRRAFVAPEQFARSYRIDQSDPAVWQYVLARKPIYEPEEIAILSDLYDARVREVDDRFAEMIGLLAEEINLDEAIVILTADHGESLGEHRMLDHQYCVYNTLIHVPLIVRWPKALRHRNLDELVQTSDLFPTILGWLDIEAEQPVEMMSRSLMTALTPAALDASRRVYTQYLNWPTNQLELVQRLNPDFDPSPWKMGYRVIFEKPWKLIYREDVTGELYHFENDPMEKKDLVGPASKTAQRLQGKLTEWSKSFAEYDPNRAVDQPTRQATEELRQRLRNLGYVQ